MLHEFLIANRVDLVDRCRIKIVQRSAPRATDYQLLHGIPLFLEHLAKTLREEQEIPDPGNRTQGDPPIGTNAHSSELAASAARHGRELLERGFTIDQVVYDYGDLCQAITELAVERRAQIDVDEFRTLQRCLDHAIAVAVTAFSGPRNPSVADHGALALGERVDRLMQQRNLAQTATLALSAIKAGHVGLSGATGALLDGSLVKLSNLIGRSLAEIRMTPGAPAIRHLFSVADFIAEVKASATLEARLHECALTGPPVDPALAVYGDRDVLFSAVGNLLQNAFRYSHAEGEVSLDAYGSSGRILIDVADSCGGIAPESADRIFLPLTLHEDGNGHSGHGLSMSRRGVEANDGHLSWRDLPGRGCVFTIDLPRQ
jgi:signal transduction histidine kinase